MPTSPFLRKVIALDKVKEPEKFVEAPNCQQESETNGETEDAGDSTLVNAKRLEEFEPKDEHEEDSPQELISKPKTHDKSVQTMDIAELEEVTKAKTAETKQQDDDGKEDDNQSARYHHTLMALSIVTSVVLTAACIAFSFVK